MKAFTDWFFTDGYKVLVTAITPFFVALISAIFYAIAQKIKNPKLKKLMEIIPRAIIYAEKIGGTSAEKLNTAVEYVKSTSVSSNDDYIINLIENYLSLTNQVNTNKSSTTNSSSSGNSSKSISTR